MHASTLRTLAIANLVILAAVHDSRLAAAQEAPAPPSASAIDYGDDDSWLCRPGRQDACAIDMSTTVVAADGKLERESWAADPKAPIDCFYVYPTVSLDTTPNSDMSAGPEELNVIRQQFARFASQCRPFSPLYRQVTLTALRAGIGGQPMAVDRALGYNDVRDAWNHYLEHDNGGRGFVLIGHSQGAGVLTQLVRNEIDGKPIQKQMVSALLLGSNVAVPAGKDVGGAFQHVPICRRADQTGCVVAYVTFRATMPPPENSRFGRVPGDGMVAACTNPAALAGGTGELHAYLSAGGSSIATPVEPRPWVTPPAAIDTPFVSVPGLLSAQCTSNERFSYLEVTVHGDPNDPRTDEIPGDVITGGQVLADWGLHLIDVNVAMGNLVDLVGKQARAYVAAKEHAHH
ncbi:MAG TPA: DUF3089 domain-containing protein [Thermoanaerobaculia bacterium]|nr:DUF3089 domain-containing protein [Thermoanaerobaculia bacterium]